MSETVTGRSNPFVGLRAFGEDESMLFFGRRGQTTELLERLHTSRFVAVLGYSGCGKSSLVIAGLVPKLLGGFLVRDRDRWFVARLRPGADPLGSFARALHHAFATASSTVPTAEEIRSLLAAEDFDSVLRVIARAIDGADGNLLILIDQFEELFRFEHTAGVDHDHRAVGNTFVSAVLAFATQRDTPVYVVLTMRSDFIGECAFYRGLPEALNRSMYLVPRMTREELREAIEGPIRLAGGTIARRVIDRLSDDGGLHPDQLPMLQHALMSMWSSYQAHPRTGALDLDVYEEVGGFRSALDRHVESVWAELPPDQRLIAETVFKCLTELGTDNRGIRRPATLKQLCAVAEVDPQRAIAVIDAFRAPGRSFLISPIDVPLSADTIIDISHESLIRNWERLVQWVLEEAQDATMYRRLAQTAWWFEEGTAGLWRDPELTLALHWRDRRARRAAWADRYDPGFERAMAFLDASLAEVEAEKRRRTTSSWFTSVALVLSGLVAGALVSWFLLHQ